jgi:hypothetical protein
MDVVDSIGENNCERVFGLGGNLGGGCHLDGRALIPRLERTDHFDRSTQLPVELDEIICRNPVLLMDARTDCLNRIAGQEFAINVKAENVARAAISRVPLPRDLARVRFVEDRIEKRLVGQSRWKCPPSGIPDKTQLSLTSRAK